MDRKTYKILRHIEKLGFITFEQLLALLDCSPDNYRADPWYYSVMSCLNNKYANDDESDLSRIFFLKPEIKGMLENKRLTFWHNFRMELFAAITAIATAGAFVSGIFL